MTELLTFDSAYPTLVAMTTGRNFLGDHPEVFHLNSQQMPLRNFTNFASDANNAPTIQFSFFYRPLNHISPPRHRRLHHHHNLRNRYRHHRITSTSVAIVIITLIAFVELPPQSNTWHDHHHHHHHKHHHNHCHHHLNHHRHHHRRRRHHHDCDQNRHYRKWKRTVLSDVISGSISCFHCNSRNDFKLFAKRLSW